MPRTIFRVFFSSTFGDFQAERERLRAEVWPKLEALCASYGASFHVVDLRWGISPSVATTHDTIQICLDEVRRCQELSPIPKPNFLMLIGDRYGWRPPSVAIPDADFRLIQKAVSREDAAFFASWYRRDDNAVPPVWCLKPREGEYASYDAWGPVENRLVAMQHAVAEKLALAPEKYIYSATHMEVVDGLLTLEGLQDHIFSFNRTLNNLPEPASKGIARRFADYLPDGTRDPEAVTLLDKLKEQIAEVLPETQIHLFQADWLGDEATPISTAHLDRLCADVETALLSVIKPELEQIASTSPLEEELEGQRQFLQETGAILIGRDKELKRIQAYLDRKKAPYPLIVQATGGCGKSALMARAVMQQEDTPPATLIYRFIGAAPRSWQPLTFLQDLIQQIAEAYGQEPPALPEEGGIKAIAELFHQQLELATEEQPLSIFIDAIDQFNATVPVQYSDLFPKALPANVKMVLSVLEGKDADQLNAVYPKTSKITLEPLSQAACGKILDALLNGRKLTKEQRTAIMDKAKASGLPLWLTLTAPIARKLSSWDEEPNLPSDTKELARYVIKQIADKHGHEITTASLRYIKLARFGLSETELQEILWRDPEVRAEFDRNKNPDQPQVNALPPVFWSRLYAELDPYINEYWMDGQLLHRYFHRVFGEVADEMDGETRKTLHSRLAEYFAQQPLYLSPRTQGEGQGEGGGDLQPNGRKLMELPYNLVNAGRIEEARVTITDFDFAMAKCRLNRSDDWSNDFRLAARGEKSREYKIWESFVKTNAHILRRGNNEWPAHKILLQLAIEHADDSPVTIGAERFLADGKCDWPWLRRELRVKHAGSDPCVVVFEGHEEDVCGVHLLPNGQALSWSEDKTLRLWDLGSGECLRTMEGYTFSISDSYILDDGRILLLSRDNAFYLLNIDTGECGASLADLEENHIQNSELGVFWPKDGSIILWNLENGKCLNIFQQLGWQSSSVKNAHLLASNSAISADNNTIKIWNLRNRKCVRVLRGHEKDIRGLTVLENQRVVSWSDDGTIRLWDLDTCKCIMILEGDSGRIVGTEITDNRILSWSWKGTIQLWDLNSGNKVKELHGHKMMIWGGATMISNSQVVSWSNDKTIRLWDLETESCLKVMEGHDRGIKGVKILSEDRFISWSDDYTLRLWNLAGECLNVMNGHGSEIHDVILISDNKVLSVSGDGTLRLWDILQGKIDMLDGHTAGIKGFHLLPHDNKAFSWSEDETMRLWDTITGHCTVLINGFSRNVRGISLISNDIVLSWSALGGPVQWWDIINGVCLDSVTCENTSSMTRFIIITDGRAVGWHHDGSISLWDIENRNCYSIFKGHKKFKLYFSGLCKLTSTKIVSWAEDRVLKLWDFELNKCLKILKGGMAQIKGVLNLLNDRLIAWDENGSLHLWDLENGKHLKKIKAHADSVAGVKLVADNSVLSWCGGYENEDFSLRQWDLESGECLQTLVGHTDGIIGVHLLNGGLVLSWSSDDTLRLWNLDNGQCLEVYQRNRLFSAPKEIWQAYLGECQTNASAGIDAIGNVSLLGYEHRKTGGCVQWNGSSECTARNLFDDGHAIFTQANGQVCFLCLWQGNRRTMLVDFV